MKIQMTQQFRHGSSSSSCHTPLKLLAIGLGLGIITNGQALAAPIVNSSAIRNALKYPTYLNRSGQILSNSANTHTLPLRDRAKAAYVAYKLRDGTQLPSTITVIRSSAPLSASIRQVMAQLASTNGRVAILTANGLFLVRALRASVDPGSSDPPPSNPGSNNPPPNGGPDSPGGDTPPPPPVPEPSLLAFAGLTFAFVALRRKFSRKW